MARHEELRPPKALFRAGRDTAEAFYPDLGFGNTSASVHMPPTPNKTFPDVLASHAEEFRQLSVTDSLFIQGPRQVSVEAGANVLPMMSRFVEHSEVFKPVVGFVAVDVVHVFGGEQLAPQAPLNNPSVLVHLLPVNSNDPIAVNVAAMNELASNVTFPTTERALVWAQSRPLFEEGRSARCAGKNDGCHSSKIPCPYGCRKECCAAFMEQQEPPL